MDNIQSDTLDICVDCIHVMAVHIICVVHVANPPTKFKYLIIFITSAWSIVVLAIFRTGLVLF